MEQLRWRLYQLAPTLLLAVTVAALLLLQQERSTHKTVSGFAQGELERIASLESGRILTITVEPGQEVVKGQLIARLDPTLLDAEIAVEEAERMKLQAELGSARAQSDRQTHLDTLELTDSVDSARVSLAKEEAALEQARAQESILRAELERLNGLIERKLATADALAKLRVEHAGIAQEVQERPKNIEALKLRMENAALLQKSAPVSVTAAAAAPYSRALEVVERRLELLKERRARLVLVAPEHGRILSVLKHAAEVVMPGEEIATLVHTRASRVTACLSEQDALSTAVGDPVTVYPRGRQGEGISGVAIALGPIVDQLPIRCRKYASVPSWGRDLIIQLDQPLDTIPGEAFEVQLHATDSSRRSVSLPSAPDSGRQPSEGASAQPGLQHATETEAPPRILAATSTGSRTLGGQQGSREVAVSTSDTAVAASPVTPRTLTQADIRQMQLSSTFTERYNLEPSGWSWIPERARYLLVSDDPGTKRSGKHLPVLFSMDQQGRIDPEALAVEGATSLNDLESIAVVGSTAYVLSSQSLNREGTRDPDRTAFLKLRLDGARVRVEAQVSLFSAIARLGSLAWEGLGLSAGSSQGNSDPELNIEAMTWYQDGLYLGLKAPQDLLGRSLIWKLQDPDSFLATGVLRPGQLSLFGRVSLTAQIDGKQVLGGISEMLFLPDGRLLLTATPSQSKEGRQGGGLWLIEDPSARALVAREVMRFPGLKPEALSLAPAPGHIAIAFDTGGVDPCFVELSWP